MREHKTPTMLITGAAGMLGSALVPAASAAGYRVVATDIRPGMARLDVRDGAAVEQAVEDIGPDLLVHLAALTDLEQCERDPAAAMLTNAAGTAHVARAAASREIPLAYISTAGVFDGRNSNGYHETDPVNPINSYGASKYEGEEAIRRDCAHAAIVRAGWMMGGGQRDHKFVGAVLAQIRAGAPVIHAVTDRTGTPTYTRDFATALLGLAAVGWDGLFHLAGHGAACRYDVAAHLLHTLGVNDRIRLEPVASSFFTDRYPVTRPACEVLHNTAAARLGLDRMRGWQQAFTDYLHTDFPADLAATGTGRLATTGQPR
jgi:dTDP-4-dehydrorhamnose reductase